jgi:DNA polymerase III delta subunit
MSSQAYSLAGLVLGKEKSTSQIAKDLGVHPYGLEKMSGYAQKLDEGKLNSIVEALAHADQRMKNGVDPWDALETCLLKIASI